ncbi:MAG TPA: DUF1579 domain-containing protein [Chitinophagaceae bacterium]|nr:DUF1579 domain-containing protein [Chitinophagaceae bacterium]
MKRITNTLCLALLCTAMACNNTNSSIESNADSTSKSADTATSSVDETPSMKDSAAMMQAWMAYATPGDMHAMLAKNNGTWTTEMTMWMTPDAPPQKSTGTMTNKMIYDGRYQQSTYKGDFGGMPFEGTSIMAYDNAKKKFVSTWYDNMGTGLMTMEGTHDGNNTITFTGTSVDPTNGKECTMRETFTQIDENTQKMEMYSKYKGGKEYKTMEITLKRKK